MESYIEIDEVTKDKLYYKCIADSSDQRIFECPDNKSILDGFSRKDNPKNFRDYTQYVAVKIQTLDFVFLVELLSFKGKTLSNDLYNFAERTVVSLEPYFRTIAPLYKKML